MENFGGERRLARIAISGDLLKDCITIGCEVRGNFKCIKGIPKDAIFICSIFKDVEQITYLVFYHKSFTPVLIGQDIPIINVVHKHEAING